MSWRFADSTAQQEPENLSENLVPGLEAVDPQGRDEIHGPPAIRSLGGLSARPLPLVVPPRLRLFCWCQFGPCPFVALRAKAVEEPRLRSCTGVFLSLAVGTALSARSSQAQIARNSLTASMITGTSVP